jgi:hypothetical protein
MALVQAGKELNEAEAEDLVAFLKTLTGEYINTPLGQLKDSDLR